MQRLIAAVLAVAWWNADGARLAGEDAGDGALVFVCEHGTVKSVIAMAWFNALAAKRGLRVRAISRGLAPDPEVPGAIADGLAKDGLALEGFLPQRLTAHDLERAERVVAIGVPEARITAVGPASVESWDAIPPATQDYAAASAALKAQVERLLDAAARMGP